MRERCEREHYLIDLGNISTSSDNSDLVLSPTPPQFTLNDNQELTFDYFKISPANLGRRGLLKATLSFLDSAQDVVINGW
ncbi:MAG TPA: hypothetical protein VIT23_14520 [Terrimicrobiaceae bacterium]